MSQQHYHNSYWLCLTAPHSWKSLTVAPKKSQVWFF